MGDLAQARRFFEPDLQIYPDISHHKDVIEALFPYDSTYVHENLLSVSRDRTTVFVCFSNRSGSNLLLDAFGRIGFGCEAGDEFFNSESVSSYASEYKFKKFEDYLEFIFRIRCFRKSLFLKVGPSQLFWLANSGILSTYFSEARYLHIERSDKIAQAISLYIAEQTGSYIQRLGEAGPMRSNIPFAAEKIMDRLRHIIDANSLFQYFFSLHGITPVKTLYEALEADPSNEIGRLAEALRIEHDLPRGWGQALAAQPPRINKQSDRVNLDLIREFRSHFSIRANNQEVA